MDINKKIQSNIKNHHCQFCKKQATKVVSIMLKALPDAPSEFANYEFYSDPIYTCDKHEIELLFDKSTETDTSE